MAKTTKKTSAPTINVTGMSIEDIMNIGAAGISKLNEKDLRALTTRLVSAANKRLARLDKAGINYTPALHSLYTQGKRRFSVTGKHLNKLRMEFANVRNFLNDKTSSVQGYKKFAKKFSDLFGLDYQKTLNKHTKEGKQFAGIQEVIELLKEYDPAFALKSPSEQIRAALRYIADNGNDVDAAIASIKAKMEAKAEEDAAAQEAMDDVSTNDLGAWMPNGSEWTDIESLEDDSLPFDY